LRLIYDAAHAFGVKVGTKPIGHFGDLSMFSFHATKSFHSMEGGLLTFKESGLKGIFDYLKNFGFKSELEVVMPGTNAKMNEMQALIGILPLKYREEVIHKRARITDLYRQPLKEIRGIY
jgi:dTDP-4-amino-4,6-dideoxygalactose transaminase